MTDDPTAATSDPGGGRGGRSPRRGFIEDVAAELLAMRRDVAETNAVTRESAGLLAEALPRIEGVENAVGALTGRLDALEGATADDGAAPAGDSEAFADTAPSALDVHGVAAKPKGPWCWPLLDPDEAAAAWEALAQWVGEVLGPWYGLTRGQLPDCWPVHRRAVVELSWAHLSYREAFAKNAAPHLAAEWHARWLPGALAGVAAAIDPAECAPSWHRMDKKARQDELVEQRDRTGEPPQGAAQPAGSPPNTWAQEQAADEAAKRRERIARRRRDTSAGRPRHVSGAAMPHAEQEPTSARNWLAYFQEAAQEDIGRRRVNDHRLEHWDYRIGDTDTR